VYDLLVEAAKRHPVEGNAEGSYLTMRSKEGAIFFVINIVGNFGTVFCDNGYYNKAIAAHPVSALPGYVMGGLSWFAIVSLLRISLSRCHPVFFVFFSALTNRDISFSPGSVQRQWVLLLLRQKQIQRSQHILLRGCLLRMSMQVWYCRMRQ
jgi:Na+/proline symporter